MSGGIETVTVHGGLFCDQGDQALNVKSAVGRGGQRGHYQDGPSGSRQLCRPTTPFPPVPINPKLIPLLSNITALNVSIAPGSVVQHARAFAGLG
jgi:hypothetical protein